MRSRRHWFAAMVILKSIAVTPATAQNTPATVMPMANMPMMMTSDPVGVSMNRAGSGTSWLPDAVSLPEAQFQAGTWDLMAHVAVFGQYDWQQGPRGATQLGSLNWGMLMASHELAGGRFSARMMLSLDAAGVTPRGYPLLLQTGEFYDDDPIHDRQHPHNFWTELSATYERPITQHVAFSLYAAPSGDPALGPVAYMHRPSAMDDPIAPLGHHWEDATHVSFGVLTAGFFTHSIKLEGSAFNGREPDQDRWAIDPITLDSYSGRLSYNPSEHWSLSTSYGYLASPEAETPTISEHRTTASVMNGFAIGTSGQMATTFVYGANRLSSSQTTSPSALVESEAVLDTRNTVLGRIEYVRKSAEDLVLTAPPFDFPPGRQFGVSALSLGYIREVAHWGGGTLGLGAVGTVNIVPGALEGAYGSSTPLGGMIFLRLRPGQLGGSAMAGMRGMTSMSDLPKNDLPEPDLPEPDLPDMIHHA